MAQQIWGIQVKETKAGSDYAPTQQPQACGLCSQKLWDTHTHTHARMRAHTRAHTHTNTHTDQIQIQKHKPHFLSTAAPKLKRWVIIFPPGTRSACRDKLVSVWVAKGSNYYQGTPATNGRYHTERVKINPYVLYLLFFWQMQITSPI